MTNTALPIRSILCAVDFSAHAAQALRQAAALAVRARARLSVAWVNDPLLARAATAYALDPQGEQARVDLREFVATSLPRGAQELPDSEIVIADGKADVEILKLAKAQNADLIVIGTHGLSGYRKMFFGSTAERVLRHTTVRVLVVPHGEGRTRLLDAEQPGTDLGGVIVAVDLGAEAKALATFGAGLARALGTRPVFVHVVARHRVPPRWQPAIEVRQRSDVYHAEEQLSHLAAEVGDGAIDTLVSLGHAAEEIATIADKRHASLVVMGLIGHATLFSAKPGSIAYRVLILTSTPVLVVPPASLQPGA